MNFCISFLGNGRRKEIRYSIASFRYKNGQDPLPWSFYISLLELGYGLPDDRCRFKGLLIYSIIHGVQVALAGFHQPKDWGEWDKDRLHYWSPVAYTIDDKLVRMYALDDDECPNNKKVWDPVTYDKLPDLAKKAKESEPLIKYLAAQTKWDFKHLGIVADLADNLIEIDLYKAKYPEWIAKPKGLKGYTGEKLRKEILEFAEIHQNACADYEPCGKLMSGVWLAHILRSLEDAGKGKGPKVIGYASVSLSVVF